MRDINVTMQELIEFFAVSQQTISVWKRKGFGNACMESHNHYDLKKAFDWYKGYKVEGKNEEGEDTLAEIKKKQALVNLAISKHSLDELNKRYIDTTEMYKMWISRYLEFQAGFWIRAIRLAPLLENKSRQEIEEIISRYDIELMTHFKREGSFTKGVNWTEEEKKMIFKYLDEMKNEI